MRPGAHRTRREFRARPPLPPNLSDYFMSDVPESVTLVSGVVSAWAGLAGSLTFSQATAGNRPNYGANGDKAKGKPAVRCAVSTARWMRTGTGSTIFASGSRPWAFGVYAVSTLPAGEAWIIGAGVNASANNFGMWDDGGFPTNRYSKLRDTGTQVSGLTPDTNVHAVQLYLDGTLTHQKHDGTDITASDTGSLGSNLNVISLGCAPAFGGATPSNTDHYFWMFCTSKPSDDYITALIDWARKRYGVV